jgi:hypothetical protein
MKNEKKNYFHALDPYLMIKFELQNESNRVLSSNGRINSDDIDIKRAIIKKSKESKL